MYNFSSCNYSFSIWVHAFVMSWRPHTHVSFKLFRRIFALCGRPARPTAPPPPHFRNNYAKLIKKTFLTFWRTAARARPSETIRVLFKLKGHGAHVSNFEALFRQFRHLFILFYSLRLCFIILFSYPHKKGISKNNLMNFKISIILQEITQFSFKIEININCTHT